RVGGKARARAAARTWSAAIDSALEFDAPSSDLALDRDGARVLDAGVGVHALPSSRHRVRSVFHLQVGAGLWVDRRETFDPGGEIAREDKGAAPAFDRAQLTTVY